MKKIKTVPALFLFLIGVRLGTLALTAAVDAWMRPAEPEFDPVKRMQARAALRQKEKEAVRKQILVDLEMLKKKYEWELWLRVLESLLADATLLSDTKLVELTALMLPESDIPKELSQMQVVPQEALFSAVAELIRKQELFDLKAVMEKATPKAALRKYRIHLVPEPEEEGRPTVIALARERASARVEYFTMREGPASAPGSSWTGRQNGFLLSLLLAVLAFFGGVVSMVMELKEYFILGGVGVGVVLLLSYLAMSAKRRF